MTKNLPSKPESVAKKKSIYRVSPMPKYSVLLSSVLLWQKWFGNCTFVCVRGGLVDYFGGEGGAKENVLRFQVPVVQWVDSTTHWINLCLCPVDNAIMVSLILIYWLVPSIFFNNRGHISRVWHIKVGLNKIIDQQSTWSFLWGLLEWSRCSYFVIMS